MDELGRAIVEGLNHKDRSALVRVLVTEAEFRTRLFKALANHPNVTQSGPDMAWTLMKNEGEDDLERALADYGGREFKFVRLEPKAVENRPGLVMHRRPSLVVETKDGRKEKLVMLGSVLDHETTHTFKLLSYRDTP